MVTKFDTGDRVVLHLPASVFSAVSKGGKIYYSVLDKGRPFPWLIPEEMIEKDDMPPETTQEDEEGEMK